MSFEGFYQNLCKQGHYWINSTYGYNDADENCPVCREKSVWSNLVDETNGSFDTNLKTGKEERIDGYIELKLREQRTCRHCKSILETTYVIPRKKKRRK
jgi:RNA polymerase subunit RPABC4/transcription elongation factor Spt4